MTYTDAMALAHSLADTYQRWYEVHTNGVDFVVVEQGDSDIGYEHYMTVSPKIKVQKGLTYND